MKISRTLAREIKKKLHSLGGEKSRLIEVTGNNNNKTKRKKKRKAALSHRTNLTLLEAFLSTNSPWYCFSAQGSLLTTLRPKSTSVLTNVRVGLRPTADTGAPRCFAVSDGMPSKDSGSWKECSPGRSGRNASLNRRVSPPANF